mmetsp:Transcript_33986/g.70162  ORF Transcript_33986/g.70162 Transcript_33986/m.70162 type:complete len:84 (+) Transcript_33986:1167-1418(+)
MGARYDADGENGECGVSLPPNKVLTFCNAKATSCGCNPSLSSVSSSILSSCGIAPDAWAQHDVCWMYQCHELGAPERDKCCAC